jgi:hypothetical protein
MTMDTLDKPLASRSQASVEPQQPPLGVERGEIRIKGEALLVPSVQIEGRTVVTTGGILKVATVRDEELIENDTIAEPERFISQLKGSGLQADIFTFGQRVPNVAAKHSYKTEWENAAAIPVTTYAQWLKERCEYSIRKGVNRAAKLGVVTRIVKFDEQLLDAICRIYNESPVRQGKRFWHYGKNREAVKRAMETYLDRSIFIGAYFQEELIGFIKMTWVGTTGTLTQIISMRKHFDKKPNNSLLAKGVEVCETEGKSHFIYGSFVYFDPNSTLTEFKRRSGFEPFPLPRYYVPLTLKGKIALKLGLHRGVIGNTPKPLLSLFLKARKYRFDRKSRQGSQQGK